VGVLVVGVVVNVLGEVAVEDLKFGGVDWVSAAPGDFTVLDSSEFVVLLPKVALEVSAAAANRIMAASPLVIGLLSSS
jgi:hypothetical protein